MRASRGNIAHSTLMDEGKMYKLLATHGSKLRPDISRCVIPLNVPFNTLMLAEPVISTFVSIPFSQIYQAPSIEVRDQNINEACLLL